MIVPRIIQMAMREFKQKMTELSRSWDMEHLTAELAGVVGEGLKQALTGAGQAAYRAFLESYDLAENRPWRSRGGWCAGSASARRPF